MEMKLEIDIQIDISQISTGLWYLPLGATTPIVYRTNYRVYKQLQLLCGEDILFVVFLLLVFLTHYA